MFATANHFRHAARRFGVRECRDYKSKFGVTAEICALSWNMFDLDAVGRGATFAHMLMGLMLLKTYAKEAVLAGIAGVCRATYRKWAWAMIMGIAGLRRCVIRLANRFKRDRGHTCKLSVDGTDCILWEPSPFSTSWFTHKHRTAGHRYEVAVCIQTGDICWINDPFRCGRWSDLMTFRRNLKGLLRPGEMVECDGGCRGDPACRQRDIIFNASDKRAKEAARSRHETINSDLKRFECLKQAWRHPRNLHKFAFAACAVLTQLECNGNPPYQVYY